MKIYGIANTRGMGLTIRLGEGLPDLLGLGHGRRSSCRCSEWKPSCERSFVRTHR